jgi:hypothetical protein
MTAQPWKIVEWWIGAGAARATYAHDPTGVRRLCDTHSRRAHTRGADQFCIKHDVFSGCTIFVEIFIVMPSI